MYQAPAQTLDTARTRTTASMAADRIVRSFVGVLIIPCPSGAFRAPVVTLSGVKANLYYAIEKHLLPDALVGVERFWKLVRASHTPSLQTWRPRVNGFQLKAIQAARLPETEQEWQCVRLVVDTMSEWIQGDSSPEVFLQELKDAVVDCESWWNSRTKRSSDGSAWSHGVSDQNKNSLLTPSGFIPKPLLAHALVPDLLDLSDQACGLKLTSAHRQLVNAALEPSVSATSMSLVRPSGSCLGMPSAEQACHLPQTQDNPQSSGPANAALRSACHAHDGHHLAADQAQVPGQSPLEPCLNHHPHQSNEALTCPSLSGQAQHSDKIVSLNVGGRLFVTTAATLTSVKDSFLWKVVTAHQLAAAPQAAPLAGFFIDRNGKSFEYILEYLRTVRFGDPGQGLALPTSQTELAQLIREARFFGLPGLTAVASACLDASNAHAQGIVSGPRSPALVDFEYDSIYLETGFHPVNSGMFQKHQAATMEKLTKEVQLRQAKGFTVLEYKSRVAHDRAGIPDPLTSLHFLVSMRKAQS